MRTLLAISALVMNIGATPPPAVSRPIPVQPRHNELTDPGTTRACRDRIEEVRQQRGLPKLDSRNASPGQPLLIAAVDMQLGGCSVMVMYANLNDIRPLPAAQDTDRLWPAR